MRKWIENNRLRLAIEHIQFRLVFVLLVALIGLSPYLGTHDLGSWLITAVQVMIMIFIILYMIESDIVFFSSLLIALISLIASAVYLWGASDYGYYILCLTSSVLYILAIHTVFKKVILKSEITIETIFASLVIYIFIALSYGYIYVLVQFNFPNAFHFANITLNPDFNQDHHLIYFSFVTLTTVGYGDISPLNDYARAITILESMTGVLYLAVLVARLVAAFEHDVKK